MDGTPILWSHGMLITFTVLQVGVLVLTAILAAYYYVKDRGKQ